jgi:regulator of sirC expression with transglutaminase-like and TPR domain
VPPLLRVPLATQLQSVLAHDPIDLPRAALVIARLEFPDLPAAPTLDTLDRIARRATAALAPLAAQPVRARVAALNRVVFEEEGFAGNHAHYDDFRNSCLNVVVERRLGIPITLALIYMEVARRAGLEVRGVGFPGHFLMRVAAGPAPEPMRDLILDPFDAGAELDEEACRALLARHMGTFNEDLPFDRTLLDPCSPRHILARMLNNLKRTYVDLRSFPQARQVTDLLLVVEPARLSELRDRGLLAYHLDDYPAALRDLEGYLRLSPRRETHSDEDRRDEHQQIWEHVKTLRKRVANLN